MKKALLYLFLFNLALSAADDAKALFESKCATCHALPDRESLGEKQWQAVLKTMQRRLREAGKPELTADEFAKIHCYLSGSAGAACKPAGAR